MSCRCGFDGDGEHPCHHEGYACKKPAKQYFYNPRPVALAGSSLKLEVVDTWACDEHWAAFQRKLESRK